MVGSILGRGRDFSLLFVDQTDPVQWILEDLFPGPQREADHLSVSTAEFKNM